MQSERAVSDWFRSASSVSWSATGPPDRHADRTCGFAVCSSNVSPRHRGLSRKTDAIECVARRDPTRCDHANNHQVSAMSDSHTAASRAINLENIRFIQETLLQREKELTAARRISEALSQRIK